MRNSTLLCWRDFLGIASLMLEILTKIFRRILTENTQQYVALQEGFIMDRIVDARNLN